MKNNLILLSCLSAGVGQLVATPAQAEEGKIKQTQ